MEDLMGAIRLFAFNFVPRSYARCDGQLLAISQNTALFSLLGTTYGGDGRTTFGIPDLRGRAPIHFGQAPGLTDHRIGVPAGFETHSLTEAQMPAHTHAATAQSTLHGEQANADARVPEDRMLAVPGQGNEIYADPTTAQDDRVLASGSVLTQVDIQSAGSSAAFSIMQPVLPVQFAICTEGIYPSRD